MQIRAKGTIQHGRKHHRAGSVLELHDDEALRLVARGRAEHVEAASEPVGGSDPLSDLAREFAAYNATDAITLVQMTDDAKQLIAFETIEQQRPKPRSTVLAAIEQRRQDLALIAAGGAPDSAAACDPLGGEAHTA